MPAAAMRSVGLPSMRAPAKRIWPEVRTKVLQMARRVVVLPAPFAPEERDHPAVFHRERDAAEHRRVPVARVDVLELEERGHDGSPR